MFLLLCAREIVDEFGKKGFQFAFPTMPGILVRPKRVFHQFPWKLRENFKDIQVSILMRCIISQLRLFYISETKSVPKNTAISNEVTHGSWKSLECDRPRLHVPKHTIVRREFKLMWDRPSRRRSFEVAIYFRYLREGNPVGFVSRQK